MPTSSRRTRLPVIEHLVANPQDFSFTQVIRLLERAAVFSEQEKTPGAIHQSTTQAVARFSPPSKEVLRFKSNDSLSFPSQAIETIKKNPADEQNQQWQVLVNFIGLTGAMGVMPFHYTELLLDRVKKRDPAMSKFLNLFNHRTVSLFFEASNKYRLPFDYERSELRAQANKGENKHTKIFLSLLGLGTKHLQNRQSVRDESLIFYSGLFSHSVKNSGGLKQIIEDYFDVPVSVQGFIGQWQELIDDVRSRLGSRANRKGQNVCLGRSTMLGKQGWFAQGKSRIKIGPLDKEQFDRFAPGTGSLKALNQLVSHYIGMEQDYDFVIEVKRENVPDKIALDRKAPPLLAWNSWLAGKPNTNSDGDDYMQISVSSKKLQ